METRRGWFKKTDLWIVVLILLAAAAAGLAWRLFAPKDGEVRAEIWRDNVLIQTISLNDATDRVFGLDDVPGVKFHVTADGKIRFEENDCPDKICVNTGWLNGAGESAVCLPKSLILKIVRVSGDDSDDTDLVQ